MEGDGLPNPPHRDANKNGKSLAMLHGRCLGGLVGASRGVLGASLGNIGWF